MALIQFEACLPLSLSGRTTFNMMITVHVIMLIVLDASNRQAEFGSLASVVYIAQMPLLLRFGGSSEILAWMKCSATAAIMVIPHQTGWSLIKETRQ